MTSINLQQRDLEQRDALVERLFQSSLGMMDILTIYLGDRLGLYRALAELGPATPSQLAATTRTHERYAREWLEQQAVAGLLDVETQTDGVAPRYSLSPAHTEVLLDRDSLSYMTPLTRQLVGTALPLPALLEAFRTGGGVPYEQYGPDIREGISHANRALFVNLLGSEWIPSIPDLHARLQAEPPAKVADIGCGTGWSSISLARAYPKVQIDGYDLDEASIATAKSNAEAEGLSDRVRFRVHDASDPSLSGRYDLAMAIECIHDMTRPVQALRTMRGLVGETGTVLVVDERVGESFVAPGDEIEQMYYGFSVLHCLPVGMAESPSAGTGTVMRPDVLRGYAQEAGFRDIEILPIEHDLWCFYRLVS